MSNWSSTWNLIRTDANLALIVIIDILSYLLSFSISSTFPQSSRELTLSSISCMASFMLSRCFSACPSCNRSRRSNIHTFVLQIPANATSTLPSSTITNNIIEDSFVAIAIYNVYEWHITMLTNGTYHWSTPWWLTNGVPFVSPIPLTNGTYGWWTGNLTNGMQQV